MFRGLAQIRHVSTKLIDKEKGLYSVPVQFLNGYNETISIDAVYQDTDPSNDSKAIVFSQHGAPGSHRDFKHLIPHLKEQNIRMVSFNYPGLGFTPWHNRLTSTNDERNRFAQAIIDALKLTEKNNLIVLGHSRGGENALQLGANNIDSTIGVVMLNSVGLWMHKGIRPYWLLYPLIWLSIKRFSPIYPLLNYVYNNFLGLKVPNGEMASNAMIQLSTFSFDKQLPFVHEVSNHPKIKVLYAFSGKDMLIEPENSIEFSRSFKDMKELICSTKRDNEEDNERIINELKTLFESGHRLASTYFVKEDHFLQKNRAKFVAKAIVSMVETSKQTPAS